MKGTILEKILESTRVRVSDAKREIDDAQMVDITKDARTNEISHRFRDTLSDRSRTNIIAEFKKASPSKGIINSNVGAGDVAKLYESGGAAAISVLTEEDHFKGSVDDLREVRSRTDLPILRKDFVFDRYQIYEAAAAGADAILLIAAMLDNTEIEDLRQIAESELRLDALVEVHTIDELERVKNTGAKLIGVNNRDLKTFNVSLDVSRKLILSKPDDTIMISESGLRSPEDLVELRELGYSGFLIGETLMRSGDPVRELEKLTTETTE
jgi:indole-3-glycerol phosphate synthase